MQEQLSLLRAWFYERGDWDKSLFHVFNDIDNPYYRDVMRLGSEAGNRHYFPFYLLLIGVIFYRQLKSSKLRTGIDFGRFRNGRLQVLTVLIVSFLADQFIIHRLKAFFALPRPFVALPSGTVTRLDFAVTPFTSFPSGHAAFAMVMVASLWPALGRVGRPAAMVYLLWVWSSRLALGVHFPSDLLAGGFCALVTVLTVKVLVRRTSGA